MRLKDKVAIITGGSSGIGFAITKAYLNEGAKVVMVSYDKEEISAATDSLCKDFDISNILGVACNVKELDDVKKVISSTIDKFGKIDILVNNAGITNSKSLFEVSDEEFINMFDVNTFGVFRFIREVAPYMKKNGGGSIINTSSMVGKYGSRIQISYASSKFAVNGITISAARELGMFNIRVNAVSPGAVMTDMTRKATDEGTREILKKMTPLMKIAEPEELAGAYVYLASDESSFTTGTIIQVDGGIVM